MKVDQNASQSARTQSTDATAPSHEANQLEDTQQERQSTPAAPRTRDSFEHSDGGERYGAPPRGGPVSHGANTSEQESDITELPADELQPGDWLSRETATDRDDVLPIELSSNEGHVSVADSAASPTDGGSVAATQKVGPLDEGSSEREVDGAYLGVDGAYGGATALEDVEPVRPSDGNDNGKLLVFVNGVSTPLDQQAGELQQLADATDSPVIGLHNATFGTLRDVVQTLGDAAGVGNNPAVSTASDLIYDRITNGEDTNLVAHSQGGLIVSRALHDVQERLDEEGKSAAEIEELFNEHVEVETYGTPARRWPDGPRYVHYVNRSDLTPTLVGDALYPDALEHMGEDAEMRYFLDLHLLPGDNHHLDVYLEHRVPFDEAYGETSTEASGDGG